MKTSVTRMGTRSAMLHIVCMSAGLFELTEDTVGNVSLTLKTVSAPTMEVMLHDPTKVKPEDLKGELLSTRSAVMILKETIEYLEKQLKAIGDTGIQIEETETPPVTGEKN